MLSRHAACFTPFPAPRSRPRDCIFASADCRAFGARRGAHGRGRRRDHGLDRHRAERRVTLALSQPEVGQGSYTVLPQILAEELDADWERVKVRFVTGRRGLQDRLPAGGARAEGGRLDVDHGALRAASHRRRRRARCAHARRGGSEWRIDVSECRTEKGAVINPRGEMLSYGELAAEAAKLPLERGAAAQGQEPISTDRQAGRTPRYAGEVQRQRDLRHRRRRPGNAQSPRSRPRRPSPDRWSRSRTKPMS